MSHRHSFSLCLSEDPFQYHTAMDPPKIDWKRIFKNTLTYGLALEVIAIGSGYYLYREYKNNQEFRDRVDDKFPMMAELYTAVSGMYLKAMPKQLKDKILEEKTDEPSIAKLAEVPPVQK
ncbi:uncharacterized protein LOC129572415 [Sitodiplosis mosellana]|uniref:uncharacterized protein LOC129572415 n=1 Tax=Sitodiplosis mosellana TaxID=263140 RepID=UPI00244534EC|nr:uncharacterized protein LOC129572415 [Sitodiplosis mosellana]